MGRPKGASGPTAGGRATRGLVRGWLRSHGSARFSVTRACHEVCISRSHFCAIMRELAGEGWQIQRMEQGRSTTWRVLSAPNENA